MSFFDYAWINSLNKDQYKLRLILRDNISNPIMIEDLYGYTIKLPVPKLSNGVIHFLGFKFNDDSEGKQNIIHLFRAMLYHLSAHSLVSKYKDYIIWGKGKNDFLTSFIPSILEDLKSNKFIALNYPEKIADLCYAVTLSLLRFKNFDNIKIQSSRIMASLMLYANTGLKQFVSSDKDCLDKIFPKLDEYKNSLTEFFEEDKKLRENRLNLADCLYEALIKRGPIIESPSMPFTEYLGPCSLFSSFKRQQSPKPSNIFKKCIKVVGMSAKKKFYKEWKKTVEDEALQIFESNFIEKEKEKRVISKYDEIIQNSPLKPLTFSKQDFTNYLRLKDKVKIEINKLTDRLLVILNAYMEDFQKTVGILDLAESIQVIASEKERSDVFFLEEKIQKSYAWAILLDASMSMKHIKEHALKTAIILSETANKILPDASSWGIFSFSKNFKIIKDFSELYHSRVRARLGGLKFEGPTYLKDAVEVTGRILNNRSEDLKIILVISDGWLFEYHNTETELKKVIKRLETTGTVLIGIGAKSTRLEYLFNSNCTTFTIKDLVNQFGDLYVETLIDLI